jgi:hypothetical protein
MIAARLLLACLALLLVAPGAQAKPTALRAPTGLHGFLLRADEPVTDSFPRTPAFAWNPVPGAVRYQFQLATSSTFRENGIVFQTGGLTTPVVAPTTTLPWIDGNPHALYARVRAILRSTTSPWSGSFGFDMDPPAAPAPMPSFDGLIRWTPVEGADGYEVWLVDIGKIERVWTNVLDEREFYTFHRDPAWTGSVRWRVRALRQDNDSALRVNGIPVVGYGPWSPIYSSTNKPYVGGPITLGPTVSDTVSDGSDSSPAHRLMPAFTFSGDRTLDGRSAELFRIYVFTDRQCLNPVFTSAVIGGPAYAPRPDGPLPLPTSPEALIAARQSYFKFDGPEPPGYAYDGRRVQPTEALPAATPTTTVPSDADSGDSASGGSSGGSGSSSSGGDAQLKVSGNFGAPVDLWDTAWPQGGYYWTVVPVAATAPGSLASNIVPPAPSATATTVTVANATGFAAGDLVLLGTGLTAESATISSISGNTLTLATPLKFAHGVGDPVQRTGGNLEYRDMELAQDVCAAGRVARFGKNSEPSLTSAGELFASGLSASGRLIAGSGRARYYGNPLVAWTPAMGADMYEVQWSKSRYPFKPQPDPQHGGALGRLTLGTSAVLPLSPGVWYYRVRGFSYTLNTNAQQLSWSDPARIVVAKPKFKIVRGK